MEGVPANEGSRRGGRQNRYPPFPPPSGVNVFGFDWFNSSLSTQDVVEKFKANIMELSTPVAFYTPLQDAERERVRDLLRYYSSFSTPADSQVADPDAPTGDEQPLAAGLPSDITLAALSQLGVFRTGSNRCFVSIIDGQNQFIISETTKSVSLRNKDKHLPNDGVYLGVRTLDLVWGVCPHTIKLFTSKDSSGNIDTDNVTANRSRYVIRDFTKEDCFKDRPYVRDWPHMRFYAEVPLVSAAGYVLGSYCIVDDKPRTHFDDDEVAVLQEVSDAIAAHLENVRLVHCQRRAESLMKGLTSFVDENPTFEPTEASKDGHLVPSSLDLPGQKSNRVSGSEVEFFSAHSGEQSAYDVSILGKSSSTTAPTSSPLFSQDPSSLNSTLSDQPTIMSSGEEKSLDDGLRTHTVDAFEAGGMSSSQMPLMDSVPISERITMIFARASVLLRESMDLGGVVFLDATRKTSSLSLRDPQSWKSLSKPLDGGVQVAPPSPFELAEPEKPCGILSHALKTPPNAHQAVCEISVPEKLLNELMIAFPRGHIFSFEDKVGDDYLSPGSGQAADAAMQIISDQLARHIPVAGSVIFLPLWDWNRSCWLAGTLIWTDKSHRTLGLEELLFFRVFGDSIISEISRLHWTTTEKSKFDFITSINHELRSPLHGILASTELLRATKLLPSQEDIVKMIEMSGRNLLDTTDHLLDFCKINNSTLVRKLSPSHAFVDNSGLASDFDLGNLVEEVANILYTGQSAAGRDADIGQRSSPSVSGDGSARQVVSQMDKMSVVIRIEQSHNWKVHSVAGAWRRIVMNLLGNAMKWTKRGLVEISLSKARHHSNPKSLLAHLSVTDTGSGIAPDFLKHNLFTPFSQEDSLSEGLGLGLSIVRQLVASLGGYVTLKSEQNIGTRADVYIPIQYLEAGPCHLSGDPSPSDAQNPTTPIQACLVGLNAYPDLQETPTGILSAEEKRKLSIQSTLADVFKTHLGWSTSMTEDLEMGRGDIVVVEEETLVSMPNIAPEYGIKFFIILCGKVSILGDNLPGNAISVSQPFGPRNIRRAAERILKLHAEQLESLPATSLPAITPTVLSQQSVPELHPKAAPVEVKGEPQGDSPDITSSSVFPLRPARQQDAVHVLIVDDNEINLKIMATFLRKTSCNFVTASNGLIAFEKYVNSSQKFDFVLMGMLDLDPSFLVPLSPKAHDAWFNHIFLDLSMPVMDGLVSTSKIRQYEKEAGIKPSCIMAVTGVASAPMKQQALDVGMDDYLIKPLSLRQLKTLMNIT
ncbi:hypothetical protein N7510_010447 [Penicillium lagena]|uniref:uncharacterized protein n=1 Tax=Penicillium lagena TaxID=94218 RepID=UPI00253FEB0E|nr:uncharacterized protein N7510_010447 [Penicillium lagena]KAJ5605293.1 hypothetical protein N7510_010447 [Penicillium lagena]